MGTPNWFVPLKQKICERKIKYICEMFQDPASKAWLTEDTFLAMLTAPGSGVQAADKYAEAFYCRKLALATE